MILFTIVSISGAFLAFSSPEQSPSKYRTDTSENNFHKDFILKSKTLKSKIYPFQNPPFSVQDLYPAYAKQLQHKSTEPSLGKLPKKKTTFSNSNIDIKEKKSHLNTESDKKDFDFIQNIKVAPGIIQDHIQITFEVVKARKTTIKITDLLGNEVFTLWTGNMKEGKFDKKIMLKSKLNAGTYFVKIVSENFEKVTRVVVL